MHHIPPFISAEYILTTLQANGFEIISVNKLNVQRPCLRFHLLYEKTMQKMHFLPFLFALICLAHSVIARAM